MCHFCFFFSLLSYFHFHTICLPLLEFGLNDRGPSSLIELRSDLEFQTVLGRLLWQQSTLWEGTSTILGYHYVLILLRMLFWFSGSHLSLYSSKQKAKENSI